MTNSPPFACHQSMRECLCPEVDDNINEQIIRDYDCGLYSEHLKGMLLSRYGLYNSNHMPIDICSFEPVEGLMMAFCRECYHHLTKKRHSCKHNITPENDNHDDASDNNSDSTSGSNAENVATTSSSVRRNPPRYAIANKNYLGYVSSKFKELNRTDEACIALKVACMHITTILFSAHRQLYHDNFYVVENMAPLLRYIPCDVTGTIRACIVGAATPEQIATVKKRYPLHIDLVKEFFTEYLQKNPLYSQHQNMFKPDNFDLLTNEGTFVDRSDGSDHPVAKRLVEALCFQSTAYNNGSMDLNTSSSSTTSTSTTPSSIVNSNNSANRDGNLLAEKTKMNVSFISTIPTSSSCRWEIDPHMTDNIVRSDDYDIVFWNSRTYSHVRGLYNLLYCYPFLYPHGRGGFGERRRTTMTPTQYILRCLRLRGSPFSSHYGFLFSAFQILSKQKIFQGQYVSMRLRQSDLIASKFTREDLLQLKDYLSKATDEQRRGFKVKSHFCDLGISNIIKCSSF